MRVLTRYCFLNQGERIIVGDLAESFHFVKYRKPENQLNIYADDSNPRWLTASQMLDYDTMAGADKFGNIFIVRLPSEVNEVRELQISNASQVNALTLCPVDDPGIGGQPDGQLPHEQAVAERCCLQAPDTDQLPCGRHH
jgi:hypothetical protein